MALGSFLGKVASGVSRFLGKANTTFQKVKGMGKNFLDSHPLIQKGLSTAWEAAKNVPVIGGAVRFADTAARVIDKSLPGIADAAGKVAAAVGKGDYAGAGSAVKETAQGVKRVYENMKGGKQDVNGPTRVKKVEEPPEKKTKTGNAPPPLPPRNGGNVGATSNPPEPGKSVDSSVASSHKHMRNPFM